VAVVVVVAVVVAPLPSLVWKDTHSAAASYVSLYDLVVVEASIDVVVEVVDIVHVVQEVVALVFDRMNPYYTYLVAHYLVGTDDPLVALVHLEIVAAVVVLKVEVEELLHMVFDEVEIVEVVVVVVGVFDHTVDADLEVEVVAEELHKVSYYKGAFYHHLTLVAFGFCTLVAVAVVDCIALNSMVVVVDVDSHLFLALVAVDVVVVAVHHSPCNYYYVDISVADSAIGAAD